MKKEKKVWAITLIACWCLPPIQINAQDSLRTQNLQEIVITATKFPKSRNETGKVLTVIDEDQIKQSKGKDLAQLLNEQVGLVVNGSNSNSGKDKSIYLQGAGNGYTLILLDGIPLNDPSGINGGAYDLRLLPLDQIERIEILKGSHSTLYGSDAIAGVINVISKKASDKGVSGFGSVSYGSYKTDKEAVGISGTKNIFDYQVGYTHYKTQGISEAKESTGQDEFDKDGANQNSFQAVVGIKPISTFSIRPFFRYNTFEGKYDGGAYSDNLINKYKAKLINTGFTSQFALKKGSVNLLNGYDGSDRTYESAFPGTYKGRFQTTELFWNWEATKNLQFITGLQRQAWKMLDETAIEKNPETTILSPYASLHAKMGKGFFVEAGGRYNNHSRYGDNFTYSFNPSWVIQQRVKLFFNHSTGFKAPTLTQLFGQYGANPDLKPEKSKSFEGGVQWFSQDSKWDIRATLFDRTINDVIIYTPAYQYANFDQQHDHGFEIEPNFKFSEKINFKIFYAYVTGEVKTEVNGVESISNNLIRRPKNSFGFNMGWKVNEHFFTSLNIKSFGKRDDRYFDLNDFLVKSTELKAYTLVDVYAEYKLNKAVRFYVDAKNLLNKQYEEVYGYNTFRFNMMAGVNVSF